MAIPSPADDAVDAVANVAAFFSDVLAQADQIKPASSVEPALEPTDFPDLFDGLAAVMSTGSGAGGNDGTPAAADVGRARQYAVVETVVRRHRRRDAGR